MSLKLVRDYYLTSSAKSGNRYEKVPILIFDSHSYFLYACGDIYQENLRSLIQHIAQMELQNIGMFHGKRMAIDL